MKKNKKNPILYAVYMNVVENQLRDNDPPESRKTFERLLKKGLVNWMLRNLSPKLLQARLSGSLRRVTLLIIKGLSTTWVVYQRTRRRFNIRQHQIVSLNHPHLTEPRARRRSGEGSLGGYQRKKHAHSISFIYRHKYHLPSRCMPTFKTRKSAVAGTIFTYY